MNQVVFTVLGEPTGKGRSRFSAYQNPNTGKTYGKAYTPKKTVVYENLVRTEYERQCGDFRFPDGSMLDMRVMAYYGVTNSASKKKKEKMLAGIIRPTKKPDMDNCLKAIADALNDVAYKDDTQIVDCQVRKFYSEKPRVVIKISQIGE